MLESFRRLSPDVMNPVEPQFVYSILYAIRYRPSQGKAAVSSDNLAQNAPAVSKASKAKGGAAAPMVSSKRKEGAAKLTSEEESDDSESEDDSEDDSESEDESDSDEESKKKASKPAVSNEGGVFL